MGKFNESGIQPDVRFSSESRVSMTSRECGSNISVPESAKGGAVLRVGSTTMMC